ncbi:hypothetical protein BV25DRAFT_1911767 [Artomyces pyxidatus]|uniref:Uncharacterized protein n=1 Tax=Artomyces pyxidatus TaxID=48021 RepID=A0ACB8THI5_9AGAM|nr:hypothetical protein BV25DRAFT_1911767 [Artomyces pyxidatus]
MCGIVFSARWTVAGEANNDQEPSYKKAYEELYEQLETANAARGPDAQRRHELSIDGAILRFFASELRLRGDAPVVQPHVHAERGDVLCWNGEIFEGLDVGLHENDGVRLFAAITALDDPLRLPELLGTFEGPYALVYYHHASRKLFFARDPLGRRSLLMHSPSPENPYFILASVTVGKHSGYELSELSTECIHVLDLKDTVDAAGAFQSSLTTLPRVAQFARVSSVNHMLPSSDPESPRVQSLDVIPSFLSATVDNFIAHLDRSVSLRIRNIPQRSTASVETASRHPARLAVLFSGGIDSTMIAFLAHRHVPLDEPIDLLNVAFENPRKIRIQVEGNVGGLSKKERKLKARLAAFEDTIEGGNYDHDYLVPDRVTGLKEVEELRRICPGRQWNFVEIDVPYAESQEARPTVEAIMWPRHTVMDLSLAIALYFASRAIGQVRSDPNAQPEPYTSPARVLLNGLGSDELLGGYGRHRTAYGYGGWQAVIDELQLEIDRIPTRNLGRDDRVISAHGKETRHPFLSLNVVNFVAELPVQYKTDPRLEAGSGDKTLLRLAARKLGLVEASVRKKRAMQFGSHSARMEAGVERGSGPQALS